VVFGSGRAPGVASSLAFALRTFAARPYASSALGAGVVLSLPGVCCGIGLLMAPWLLCELLSLQISEGRGEPVTRSASWFGACAIQLGAVLLMLSVAWIVWIGLGTENATGAEGVPLPQELTPALSGVGFALLSVPLSLVFVLPFIHAPLILIDRRGSLGGAVLESARLTAEAGVLRHLWLSLTAHALQGAPLLAVVAIGVWVAPEPLPLWALLCLPLMAVSVALGQGMLVGAYRPLRAELTPPSAARPEGRAPAPLTAAWVLLVMAPLLSFALLGASLVRPSQLTAGALPSGGETLIDERLPGDGSGLSLQPRGTTLYIEADVYGGRVRASDGGGTGRLPLPTGQPIEALRVVRRGDLYGVELRQAGRSHHCWVDRAGVRLDDHLPARLASRLPSWALGLLLLSLLTTAATMLPVLAGLARMRRFSARAQEGAGATPPADAVAEFRRRTIARATWTALLLSPLSLSALYFALGAFLGFQLGW